MSYKLFVIFSTGEEIDLPVIRLPTRQLLMHTYIYICGFRRNHELKFLFLGYVHCLQHCGSHTLATSGIDMPKPAEKDRVD